MAIDIIARAIAKKAIAEPSFSNKQVLEKINENSNNVPTYNNKPLAFDDNSIYEFEGTIEPNHKYYYSTGTDFTLQLDEIDYNNEDVSFVLYLECTADIDITFDGNGLDQNSNFNNEPLFVGDIPNTEAGFHKIIGYWNDQAKRWCIGSIDYSEVS